MLRKRVASAVAVLAFAGAAYAGNITDTPVASFANLQSAFALQQIDLTGTNVSPVAGLNAQSNVLVSPFTASPFYSGTITSEIWANGAAPGPGVTDVVIKYTMTVNGVIQGADLFEHGKNQGTNLDFAALQASVHGTIQDEVTPSYGFAPDVNLTGGANVVYSFDFLTGGDSLGGAGLSQTYSWYVRSPTGAVRVNTAQTVITDGASASANILIFTTDGTPDDDLNVPGPGSAALLGLGGLLAARRRRA